MADLPDPRPLPAFDRAFLAQVPIAALDSDDLGGWGELDDAEAAHAAGCKPRRMREFVAGRAALRRALVAAGWSGRFALLVKDGGGPLLPAGWTGSITHKDGVAVAVAAPLGGGTLGVDCEVLGDRERLGIADKVLRPAELHRWRAEGGSWRGLLERFSTKEAIYKALHPHVPRYIAFEEAELQGGRIAMHLTQGEGPFKLRGERWWEGERLFSVVLARPAAP